MILWVLAAVVGVAIVTALVQRFLSDHKDQSWDDAATISLTLVLAATTVVYAYLTSRLARSQEQSIRQVRDLEERRAAALLWADLVKGLPLVRQLALSYPMRFDDAYPGLDVESSSEALEHLSTTLLASSASLSSALAKDASKCGVQVALGWSDALALARALRSGTANAAAAQRRPVEDDARIAYLANIRKDGGTEWAELLAGSEVIKALQTCAKLGSDLRTYLHS